MTFEQMLATIQALGVDASYSVRDRRIEVTLQDFEGFDENWSEIMRDYDHPAEVAAFEEMLSDECIGCDGDFYITYWFKDFSVEVGYASYDI